MSRRWSTRQDVWDRLNAEYRFEIDLCADPDNAKCRNWLSRENALAACWDGGGVGWLNPPYGRTIGQWLGKAAEARRKIVCLVPTRTNAPWWHDIVLNKATEIRFARKKLPFVEPDGHKGVPFTGHALVIFNPNVRARVSPLCTSWNWQMESTPSLAEL